MQKQQFILDKTGFPMVHSAALGAYVSWLPVTKIAFEQFLCAQPDKRFDAAWYDNILSLNGRVSPRSIGPDNFWKALLTGVTPSEAQAFLSWCGADYRLPTLAEWNSVFSEFSGIEPFSRAQVPEMGVLNVRARTVVEELASAPKQALSAAGHTPTMADSMLLRMGAMEWVEYREEGLSWGGKGEPSPKFHGSLVSASDQQPSLPNNPDGDRLYYYGIRMIKRTGH